jgi:hypothetical protein
MISTYDKVWIENKYIHEIKKYAQIYLLHKMHVLFQTTCILSFFIKLIHGFIKLHSVNICYKWNHVCVVRFNLQWLWRCKLMNLQKNVTLMSA